jgi:hypothetical protein
VTTIGDLLSLCTAHGVAWAYPTIDGLPQWCNVRVTLPNGWAVSIGMGPHHYGTNRNLELEYRLDIRCESRPPGEWLAATTVEVAIFDARGDWYIPEEAEPEFGGARPQSWVGGWWSAERVKALIVWAAAQ